MGLHQRSSMCFSIDALAVEPRSEMVLADFTSTRQANRSHNQELQGLSLTSVKYGRTRGRRPVGRSISSGSDRSISISFGSDKVKSPSWLASRAKWLSDKLII